MQQDTMLLCLDTVVNITKEMVRKRKNGREEGFSDHKYLKTENVPPNKLYEKQKRFSSTMKKRQFQ